MSASCKAVEDMELPKSEGSETEMQCEVNLEVQALPGKVQGKKRRTSDSPIDVEVDREEEKRILD